MDSPCVLTLIQQLLRNLLTVYLIYAPSFYDPFTIFLFLVDGKFIRVANKTTVFLLSFFFFTMSIFFNSILCEDELQAVAVKSQLQQIARPMYSNPPLHGALVVSTILGDPELKSLWLQEVKVCYQRLFSPLIFCYGEFASHWRSIFIWRRLGSFFFNYYRKFLYYVRVWLTGSLG